MSDPRKPIERNPTRWQPNPDPVSIVVPSLDTSASVHDQIEQIEQLITIKLQNIDENFSKIHHLLATKLLPSVKRYAVGTEPVRDAAKFWTSFYEQAAQIRIPTFDDYELSSEQGVDHASAQHEEDDDDIGDHTATLDSHRPKDAVSISVGSNASFLPPQQAAFSSTPTTARMGKHNEFSEETSWSATLESPLVRLDHEVKSFISTDSSKPTSSGSLFDYSTENPSGEEPTPRTSRTTSQKEKGKGRDSLLQNIFRHNLYNASDDTTTFSNHSLSPMKPKPRKSIPKKFNPYLPKDGKTDQWNGLVDLRDPSLSSFSSVLSHASARTASTASAGSLTFKPFERTSISRDDTDSDNSLPDFDPEVFRAPKPAPSAISRARDQNVFRLIQSPAKAAASRITNDLLKDLQKPGSASAATSSSSASYSYKARVFSSHDDTTSSVAPTPPHLSKYWSSTKYDDDTGTSLNADTSFEGMMKQMGLPPTTLAPPPGVGSTPALQIRRRSVGLGRSGANNNRSGGSQPLFSAVPKFDTEGDDSDDSYEDTMHQGPFILPPAHGLGVGGGEDDSFGSSNHSNDSLDEEDQLATGGSILNPFVQPQNNQLQHNFGDDVYDGFDDSLDDDRFMGPGQEEETIFGAAPAQRLQRFQAMGGVQGNQLRMMGEDLLEDTIGYGAQIAAAGGVQETPTPANWGGGR